MIILFSGPFSAAVDISLLLYTDAENESAAHDASNRDGANSEIYSYVCIIFRVDGDDSPIHKYYYYNNNIFFLPVVREEKRGIFIRPHKR